MSKLLISQEQADLVEQFKSDFFAFDKKYLIEMINGHYEIKPKFKTGDIVNDGYGGIREVDQVDEDGIYLYTTHQNIGKEWIGNRFVNYKRIKHATSEEIAEEKRRRFWHENGRECGDFRKNDVIYNKHFGEVDVVTSNLILPNYKDKYEIICFAHDRKDIKND